MRRRRMRPIWLPSSWAATSTNPGLGAAQGQLGGLLDDSLQVLGFFDGRPAFGEGQELSRQTLTLPAGRIRRRQPLLGFGDGRSYAGKADAAQNNHEYIIKVMGYAPGQHSYRLQLGQAQALTLQLLAFSQIMGHVDAAAEVALTVVKRGHGHQKISTQGRLMNFRKDQPQ